MGADRHLSVLKIVVSRFLATALLMPPGVPVVRLFSQSLTVVSVARARWCRWAVDSIASGAISCLLDYGVPGITDNVASSNYPVFKGPATL